MSLHSILVKAGHGFADLGKWIDDAIKVFEKDVEPVANAVIAIADPALTPIVQKIESIVSNVQTVTQAPLSSAALQAVAQSVTTLEMIAPGTVTPVVAATINKVAGQVQGVASVVVGAVTGSTAPTVTSSSAAPVATKS